MKNMLRKIGQSIAQFFASALPQAQPQIQQNAQGLNVEGAAQLLTAQARSRVILAIALFCLAYSAIGLRLVQLGYMENESIQRGLRPDIATLATRPDLLDRNGAILATDIKTFSLFAEPRRIVDVDEAVEKLTTVIPYVSPEVIYRRLSNKKSGFQWLARELTPRQRRQIMDLGVPGVGFRPETRRFYPGGALASHIVGHVNVDNAGIAGLEKYLDDTGLRELHQTGLAVGRDLEPVYLALDKRAQFAVRDELAKAIEKYQAKAAGAVILNAHTGEIVAMASLPDYDPNQPADSLKKDSLNRMTAGLFEMGSTFKTFTLAMALDNGSANMRSRYDARYALEVDGFKISDFHPEARFLSLPEVFTHSSNIGTAKIAQKAGIDEHKLFLEKLGLFNRMDIELPEVARPRVPEKWQELTSVTISYGHGMATTPLNTAIAGAALINGGKLVPPTLLRRSAEEAAALATNVMKPQTSHQINKLMRLNVEQGSGRNAEVAGYFVGGKTGTSEKVVDGRYSKDHRFNSFLAAFPMNDPKYVVLSFVDEPQIIEGQKYATSGYNAVPLTGAIIRRAAPILGLQPQFGANGEPLLVKF